MTNHQFVTVTRTLLKRGVTDLERKLVAAASTGAAGYFILTILHAYGVKFPTAIEELIPYTSALIGGYIAHSAGSVTTVTNPAPVTAPDNYDESLAAAVRRLATQEQTVITGPTAAPHESRPQTGAIPVQASFPQPIHVPDPTPDRAAWDRAGVNTPAGSTPIPDPDPLPDEVPDVAPTQAFTQVIDPDTSRAQSFMERRAAMRNHIHDGGN